MKLVLSLRQILNGEVLIRFGTSRHLGHRDKQAMFRSVMSGVPIRVAASRPEADGALVLGTGSQHLTALIGLISGSDVLGLGKPYGEPERAIDDLTAEEKSHLLDGSLVEFYVGGSYLLPHATYL